MNKSLALTRRQAALGGFAAVATLLASRMAHADVAAVQAEIAKLYGDKKMGTGRVKLDVPQIAENGLVVPVNIDVESPMTPENYVKSVHIYADGNPLPNVVSYRFTPDCGKASAAARMRLAQTQNVICIAEMSDGSLFTDKVEVKVTIGGCGG